MKFAYELLRKQNVKSVKLELSSVRRTYEVRLTFGLSEVLRRPIAIQCSRLVYP